MQSFKDSAGREWCVDLTYGTIQRVHKETNINLRTLVDGDEKNPLEPVFEFVSDPMAFGAALCAILKPEMEKRGVSVEQLMETMDGDAGFAAGQAFVGAYVNFFHPSKKAAFQKQIEKSAALTEIGVSMAMKKMDELDLEKMKAELEKKLDENLANLSNISSGNVPASSDSIPAPSLSASL